MINGPLASFPKPWFSESLGEYQARVHAASPAELEGAAETWRASLAETWRAWREEDAAREAERRRAAIAAIVTSGFESVEP